MSADTFVLLFFTAAYLLVILIVLLKYVFWVLAVNLILSCLLIFLFVVSKIVTTILYADFNYSSKTGVPHETDSRRKS